MERRRAHQKGQPGLVPVILALTAREALLNALQALYATHSCQREASLPLRILDVVNAYELPERTASIIGDAVSEICGLALPNQPLALEQHVPSL
jgi:hypothetical protein